MASFCPRVPVSWTRLLPDAASFKSVIRLVSTPPLPVYSPSAVRWGWVVGAAASSPSIPLLFPRLLPLPQVLINGAASPDRNPDSQVPASVGPALLSFLFTLFDVSIHVFCRFRPDVPCSCSDSCTRSKMAACGSCRCFDSPESAALMAQTFLSRSPSDGRTASFAGVDQNHFNRHKRWISFSAHEAGGG